MSGEGRKLSDRKGSRGSRGSQPVASRIRTSLHQENDHHINQEPHESEPVLWRHSVDDTKSHHEAIVIERSEHNMDFVLKNLGSPGRFQVLIMLALMSSMFPVSFNDQCTVFYAAQPVSSTCRIPGNYSSGNSSNFSGSFFSTVDGSNSTNGSLVQSADSGHSLSIIYADKDSCNIKNALQPDAAQMCLETLQHSFEEPDTWTLVSEWNLVCGDYWLVSFATTVYFIGVMIGSMAYGHLADKFGRKNCIASCYIGYLPLAIALVYVKQYWAFLVLRFFIGFFIQGLQSICLVLVMEMVSSQYREYIGGLQGLIGAMGAMVLGGVSYWLQRWRNIQLCLSLLSLIALSKVFFLRESLRWQMVHGKVEEAKATISQILKWNRMPQNPLLITAVDNMSESLREESQLQSSYSWIDCFRTPVIRRYTLVQSFIWFTVLFVYYGISFSISELNGNMYVNLMAASLAELPAAFLAVFFMHRYGRKKPLMIYFLCTGVFCIIAAFLNVDGNSVDNSAVQLATVKTVLVFLARFCLAGTFAVIFVFGSELFPTVIRNTAFGIGLCCHTFGGVAAPQVLLLGRNVHEILPFLIFGACCITAGLLVLTQPETLHRKMPDTIDEIECESLDANLQ